MQTSARKIYLIRHGETEWSRSGQHTGRTDIPLTAEGRKQAEELGRSLNGKKLAVWTSPLGRARETCALAGYGDQAKVDNDLREWDYGIYEGRTTEEIQSKMPDWSIWLSPIVDGESLDQLAARARQLLDRVTEATQEDIALFAHGHILRVLASQWIGMPPIAGRYLALDTASISILGYERKTRVIRQWNFTPCH